MNDTVKSGDSEGEIVHVYSVVSLRMFGYESSENTCCYVLIRAFYAVCILYVN